MHPGDADPSPPDTADSFAAAFDVERAAIHAARQRLGYPASEPPDHLVGLALSGGGIRSATFSLGVLQAFAKRNQLTAFDYLSTVSGGGYIGSWLSAWINRAPGGLEEVQEALKPRSYDRNRASEAAPITWLRKYSNYLAPKLGLLSTDALTLISTWTRNVLLNLVIFVSLLAVLFLTARALITPTIFAMRELTDEIGYSAVWLGFFLLPLAISVNLSRLVESDGRGRVHWMTTTNGVFITVIVPAGLAAFLGSLSLFSTKSSLASGIGVFAAGTMMLLLLAGALASLGSVRRDGFSVSKLSEGLAFILAYIFALTAAYLMLEAAIAFFHQLGCREFERAVVALTFGPPVILGIFGLCGSIVVGLVGRVYYERSREWWGRMNAWFLVMAFVWLVWFGLSFYSKPLLSWMDANSAGWLKALGGTAWLGSLATTLLVPKPSANRTLVQRLGSRALDLAAVVVIAGFLVIVAALTSHLLMVAAGVKPVPVTVEERSTDFTVTIGKEGQTTHTKLALTEDRSAGLSKYVTASFAEQECVLTNAPDMALCNANRGQGWWRWVPEQLDLAVPMLAICVLIFGVFGFRVDVNKFSLHNMYKNRLVRCYLGASRQRSAQPFTGFDERDDLSLGRLRAEQGREEQGGDRVKRVQRPLHLINATMNITQGDNLAWQERKAASFTFSPWLCGFSLGPTMGEELPTGTVMGQDFAILKADREVKQAYRDARYYCSRKDESSRLSLGTAMATSGASVSPNMGKNSSPPLAFVLTLFNVRLGRWSPNPAQSYWRRSSPWFGLRLLLAELFGLSNERSDFLYLSDGGHFDNSAIYELVRRECLTIVAVDAGADALRSYQDMANVVRKCRVDFGVEIRIGLDALGTETAKQADSQGYVIGTIDYGPQHDQDGIEIAGQRKIGTLIIVKPTRLAIQKLSVDVFSYSRYEDAFPHQSTTDQFFDESQFESYRCLGYCIATACLEDPAVAKVIVDAGRRAVGVPA